jgi:hypothetical protein
MAVSFSSNLTYALVCLQRLTSLAPRRLQEPLRTADPELYAFIEEENERQRSGLELIASEVRVDSRAGARARARARVLCGSFPCNQ